MNDIIQQLFSTDHNRLDFLFSHYLKNKANNRDLATRIFGKFVEGLIKHIDQEEQILFPEFERVTGMYESGPTFVMRQEHDLIKKMLFGITDGLVGREDTTHLEHELTQLLQNHNLKEERVLYPHCDTSIEQERLLEMLLEM